jgi:hypothetical protein
MKNPLILGFMVRWKVWMFAGETGVLTPDPPKWTNISAVEALLQITVSDADPPNSGQVFSWITEVENSMLARSLGTQTTLSGTMFDVFPDRGVIKDTFGWIYGTDKEIQEGFSVIPPFTPIVSIASGTMQRNKAELDDEPSWDTLKNIDEFPTVADNDYMIQYDVDKKTGKRVGYSIFFMQNQPYAGRNRLRATWTYGFNIDTQVLREYATLKVCEKVIMASLMRAKPMDVASYRVGEDFGTYVSEQFKKQLGWIRRRTKELEDKHFPANVPVSMYR